MKTVFNVVFVLSALFSGLISAQTAAVDAHLTSHNISVWDEVTILRANPTAGQRISETIYFADFVLLYGALVPSDSKDADDGLESVVPTPSSPPTGNWSPGTVVTFTRYGTDSQGTYRRRTTYMRRTDDWYRSSNTVKKLTCPGDNKCPALP